MRPMILVAFWIPGLIVNIVYTIANELFLSDSKFVYYLSLIYVLQGLQGFFLALFYGVIFKDFETKLLANFKLKL